MKNISILVILALFIISCGEDSPVNNGNNNGNGNTETLIFEKDTLNVEGFGSLYRNFTTSFNDSTIGQIKLMFTSATDITDTTYIEGFLTRDTNVTLYSTRLRNTNHVFNLNTLALNHSLRLGISFGSIYSQSTYKYFRLSNIKVYKVL